MPETTHEEVARLQEEYAKNPEGRLFVHLAEAYRRSGELERARDLLLQGLQQHSDYLSARVVLAQVEEELGQSARAREMWEDVIRLDEENEVALRSLAQLEYEEGQARKALEYYRRLVELGAQDAQVQERIAELERINGKDGGRKTAATASTGKQEPMEQQAQKLTQPRETRSAEPETSTPAVIVEQRAPEEKPAQQRAAPATRRDDAALSLAHTDAVGLSDLLVRLLEYHDSTFRADSSLTRLLALAIGEELELERIHLDALALAALLSDLGGLALSDHAARGPGDRPRAAAEREREQREVAVSLQLLQGITLPVGVHEAIRHQHERWDGSGYPDGLRDEEIPYGARVLAVARACARKLTAEQDGESPSVATALDELQREAGSRFDPVIVNVLRRVFQRRAEHGIGYGLGGRVIIVHPEELRALGLATQLHSSGYVTEMAPETARARGRLRTHASEALVLGANIPGTEVGRFIREVRANPAWSTIPVVVIDANDMEQRVELLTSGADVCFPSDVSFKEFKATLDALLRRREESVIPIVV